MAMTLPKDLDFRRTVQVSEGCIQIKVNLPLQMTKMCKISKDSLQNKFTSEQCIDDIMCKPKRTIKIVRAKDLLMEKQEWFSSRKHAELQ